MSRKYNGIVVNGKTINTWTDTDDNSGSSVTIVNGKLSSNDNDSSHSSRGREASYMGGSGSMVITVILGLLITIGVAAAFYGLCCLINLIL